MNIGCPVGFTSKVCRYNISGFIEELPSLTAKRFGHACGLLGEVILKCTYIFLEDQKLPLTLRFSPSGGVKFLIC